MVTVINPNEVEARALTGIAVADDRSAHAAAGQFLAWGCEAAVLKLGARGAFLATASTERVVPAIPVQAVDTTAAGDAFAGALAVVLAEGADLLTAVGFANAAGALSVTRLGAQPSLPRRDDVVALLRAHGLSL
jgi:ribokinase